MLPEKEWTYEYKFTTLCVLIIYRCALDLKGYGVTVYFMFTKSIRRVPHVFYVAFP